MTIKLLTDRRLPQILGINGKDLRYQVRSEVPIVSGNGRYVVGFWDGVLFLEDKICGESAYCIEVKPSIRSWGATMRQLNLYKMHQIQGAHHPKLIFPKKVFLYLQDCELDRVWRWQGITPIYTSSAVMAQQLSEEIDREIGENGA